MVGDLTGLEAFGNSDSVLLSFRDDVLLLEGDWEVAEVVAGESEGGLVLTLSFFSPSSATSLELEWVFLPVSRKLFVARDLYMNGTGCEFSVLDKLRLPLPLPVVVGVASCSISDESSFMGETFPATKSELLDVIDTESAGLVGTNGVFLLMKYWNCCSVG